MICSSVACRSGLRRAETANKGTCEETANNESGKSELQTIEPLGALGIGNNISRWPFAKSSILIWTHFMLRLNSGTIRSCAASLSLSPGRVVDLWSVPPHTRRENWGYVPLCRHFAQNACALR